MRGLITTGGHGDGPPSRELAVGAVGLGTAPLAGLFAPVGEDEAAATLEAAWAGGVRYFDTAPHYGAGLAERRLGEFLRGRPRAEFVVSTKVGRLLVPGEAAPGEAAAGEAAAGEAAAGNEGFYGAPQLARVRDYSRDGVRRSLDESLRRSGLDRFDIVLIHDPDEHWEQAVDEAYPALAELRDAGMVGAIGAGMNQSAMLARFVRETDIDVVLVAGRYSLLDREAAADLLPACRSRGVSVVVGGVLNSGVLADPRAGATFNYEPATDEVLARARAAQATCARYGVSLAAAALQFPLRHPAVTTIVVGARTADEIRDDLALAALELPTRLWDELDSVVGGQAS